MKIGHIWERKNIWIHVLIVTVCLGAFPVSASNWGRIGALDPLRLADAPLPLLEHHGFEDLAEGPLGWQVIGAKGFVDRTITHLGQNTGRLERDVQSAGPAAWAQQIRNLIPQRRYRVSGWARAEHAESVFMLGVAPTPLEPGHPAVTWARSSGSALAWHPLTFEFVAPAGGSVWLVMGGWFEGRIWWSSVQVVPVEDRPEYLSQTWNEWLERYGPIYSGLIVDARGLGVERSMGPRIYAEAGDLVYAGLGASEDQIITHGIVAYATSLAEAMANLRIAVHPLYPYALPLIVRATQVVPGIRPTSVAITDDDAWRVRHESRRFDFLEEFRVVLVIDPRPS